MNVNRPEPEIKYGSTSVNHHLAQLLFVHETIYRESKDKNNIAKHIEVLDEDIGVNPYNASTRRVMREFNLQLHKRVLDVNHIQAYDYCHKGEAYQVAKKEVEFLLSDEEKGLGGDGGMPVVEGSVHDVTEYYEIIPNLLSPIPYLIVVVKDGFLQHLSKDVGNITLFLRKCIISALNSGMNYLQELLKMYLNYKLDDNYFKSFQTKVSAS